MRDSGLMTIINWRFLQTPELLLLILFVVSALWAGTSAAFGLGDKPLRVAAAASLADVLEEINVGFTKESGIAVLLNLGASSALARQIEEGAPVDLFISADLAKMDTLAQKGLVATHTRENQLSNTLVVVVPSDSTLTISKGQDLAAPAFGKLALADPKAVPAGIYAKEWLTKLNVWEQIAPRVVATENVRAALAAVESGNVAAGIVYRTDAAISKKVKAIYEAPMEEAPKITYPMAALKAAAQPGAAKRYLEYLDSPSAQAIFVKHGFVVLPD